MKIISVQSISGGTGVTLTAAELALQAKSEGKAVVAVDTSLMRHLQRDIEEAGFDYLDDVRQLFKPMTEARWLLPNMPMHGIFYYPEREQVYMTRGEGGRIDLGYRKRAGEGPEAAQHLADTLASLDRHYDVMIVDVGTKNKRLMQLFYDVSDEVHVMLRAGMPSAGREDDWRRFIGREHVFDTGPKIMSHEDRDHVRGDLDQRGQSIALKPYIVAAEAWRNSSTVSVQV